LKVHLSYLGRQREFSRSRDVQVARKHIALFLPMFVIVIAMGFTTPLLLATRYITVTIYTGVM